MSSNKKKREELERIYGKGSMFQKAQTEEYVETLPTITGYKQFIKQRRYTTKIINQLNKAMNYHHLKHKADGGKTTIENGALVTELEHRYLHSLPRPHEEIINNHIRKWKFDFILMTTQKVLKSGELIPEEPEEYIEIPVRTYYKRPKKRMSKKEYEAKRRKKEKQEFKKIKKELEER